MQQAALLTDATYIELPCNAAPGSPIIKWRIEAMTNAKNDKQGGVTEHHRRWFQDPNTSQLTIDISLKQQQRIVLPSAGASSSSGADAMQTHEDHSDQDVHRPSLPSASTHRQHQPLSPACGQPHAGLKTQVPASTIAASTPILKDPSEAATSRLLDPHHRATDSRDPAEAARKAALRVQRQILVSSCYYREQSIHEEIALFQKLILAQGLTTSVSVLPELTWLSHHGFKDIVLYDGAQTVFLCCMYRSAFSCDEGKPGLVQGLAEWARCLHSADEVTKDLSTAAKMVHCMRVAPIFMIPKVDGNAWGRSDRKAMRQCKELQISLFTDSPSALHVAQPWPPRKSIGQSGSTYAMRKESGHMRNGHQLGSRRWISQRQPRQSARSLAVYEGMAPHRNCLAGSCLRASKAI